MSRGPELRLDLFRSMEIQGQRFSIEKSYRGGARHSLVLTWFTDRTGVKQPYVGSLCALMTQEPPWAVGTYEQRQQQLVRIANVRWYQYKGSSQALYNAPIYTRAFVTERQGNFWSCDKLEPTLVHMTPYYGSDPQFASRRALLHVALAADVAVFKPDIDYAISSSLVQDIASEDLLS